MQKSLRDFKGTDREKFTAASQWCRNHPGSELLIPAGEYTVEDKRSLEVMDKVFKGEWGSNPQPVMFNPDYEYTIGLDLTGCKDITVNAYGAVLWINGFMEPVCIRDAENITLNGLTIDHVRKPFSMGHIVATDFENQTIDVEIDPRTPFEPEASAPRVWLYDQFKKTVIKYTIDSTRFKGKVAPNVYRYRFKHKVDCIGCEAYFTHTFHSRPAVFIGHSHNVHINDVTIHSMSGMGVTGFKSSDVFFNRFRVVPSDGYNCSTNTDATHFSCCSGILSIENSIFRGHGDDCINVHNYYYHVKEVDGCKCTTFITPPDGTHSQEPDFPETGFKLGLVEKLSLAPVDTYTVKYSDALPESHIVLDHKLPEDAEENYMLCNMTELPKLIFRGNHVSRHLARGVLCKTHNAVIENNCFVEDASLGIHIAAEAYWGEGIPSDNIVIRGNEFKNCGSALSNEGSIGINIDAKDYTKVGIHNNILIEDNIFTVAENCKYAIKVRNAKNVVVRNNKMISSKKPYMYVEYSDNVSIDEQSMGSFPDGDGKGIVEI